MVYLHTFDQAYGNEVKRVSGAYLVAKRLGRVVNNDGFGKITAKNGEILDVVAVHAHTVLAEQTMSEKTQFQHVKNGKISLETFPAGGVSTHPSAI